MRTISILNWDEEETIIGFIREFLDNNVWHFNANDVCKNIALKLKRSLPLDKIRKLMKEKLHLSYKRINSRPCFINFEWLHLVRILFCLRLTNIVNNDTLLINVDETSITKDIKFNYSWTPIGKNSEIWNRKFLNSLKIVLATFSNGCWIEMFSNDTFTAESFIIFLKNLKNFLSENKSFGFHRILILLDNLPLHRTDKVMNILIN